MKAKIWNFSSWVRETDEHELSAFFDMALDRSGFNVLGAIEHRFKPQGYTRIYMLAESHLAVHTFPEEGKSYVELSSCNGAKYESFIALFSQRFPEAEQPNG